MQGLPALQGACLCYFLGQPGSGGRGLLACFGLLGQLQGGFLVVSGLERAGAVQGQQLGCGLQQGDGGCGGQGGGSFLASYCCVRNWPAPGTAGHRAKEGPRLGGLLLLLLHYYGALLSSIPERPGGSYYCDFFCLVFIFRKHFVFFCIVFKLFFFCIPS